MKTRCNSLDEHEQWFASEPDIAIQFSGGKGWRIGQTRTCPLILAVHGGCVLDHSSIVAHSAALRPSDTLIVNCRSDVAILDEIFETGRAPQVSLLKLPIDTTCFRPRDRRRARKRLGLDVADFVIGYVGRILPQRNLHLAVSLAAEMRQRFGPVRSVKLLVIGERWVDYPVLRFAEADYGAFVANQIKSFGLVDNVVYIPSVSGDEELATCYSAMDFLFHPTNSIDENFGYVPLEAMACKTPVVAFAYGGIKDSIVDNKTGFLVPTWVTSNGIRHDIGRLREIADDFWQEAERIRQVAEASRRHVERVYTFPAFVDEFQNIVTKTIRISSTTKTRCNGTDLKINNVLSDLPNTDPPWKYFESAVEHYVSVEKPMINFHSIVSLGESIKREGQYWRNTDPAWPFIIKSTLAENEIISFLSKKKNLSASACEIEKIFGDGAISLVQKLICRGILSIHEN